MVHDTPTAHAGNAFTYWMICKPIHELRDASVMCDSSWYAAEHSPWPSDTWGTHLTMALGSHIDGSLECRIWLSRRQQFGYARRYSPRLDAGVLIRRLSRPKDCAAPNFPSLRGCHIDTVNSNKRVYWVVIVSDRVLTSEQYVKLVLFLCMYYSIWCYTRVVCTTLSVA